jgi:subtilisin-like proprotein convertase family protein
MGETMKLGIRSRLPLLGVLALALCVFVGLTAGTAEAKKKKKKAANVNITKQVNQVIPPAPSPPPDTNGVLQSTITVGKKFKGREVRDVDVTETYNASGTGSFVDDIRTYLTAPNGATSELTSNLFGTSVGPLTLNDESRLYLSSQNPANNADTDALYAPYVGTAQPWYIPLNVMDGSPVKGNWTLWALNFDNNANHVHTFVSWTLKVATRAPLP